MAFSATLSSKGLRLKSPDKQAIAGGFSPTDTLFYPSILGAVLFGIGIALILELTGFKRGIRGLGLGGAIVINMVGSIALFLWLVLGSLEIRELICFLHAIGYR